MSENAAAFEIEYAGLNGTDAKAANERMLRMAPRDASDWIYILLVRVKDPSTKSGFREVPLRKGVVDRKAVFTAAKTGGVKNYFVELEGSGADAAERALKANWPVLDHGFWFDTVIRRFTNSAARRILVGPWRLLGKLSLPFCVMERTCSEQRAWLPRS